LTADSPLHTIEIEVVGSANQQPERSYVCPSCGRQFADALDFCPYDGVRLLAGDENSSSLRRVGATIAGRYHIDGVLGHGGMGTVFRAVQQPIGRQVAVKVLHHDLAQDGTFVQRFHTEAKAASVLVNPNTVTIYDFGQTEDGTLYIAMEYLRGVSLAHRLGQGALAWQHAAAIGIQVCRALSEAHRKGIVHRDLKPENIMLLAADDGSLLIKVLDFGIAKMLEAPGRASLKGTPVTQVGVIVGTPQYMSPEQARGAQPSPASDLYALGVILFEAISGKVPFLEEEPILLLGLHMKAPPPPLTSPSEGLPPALVRLVDQLLAKAPATRPGPAAEVGTTLKRIVGDVAVQAVDVIGPARPPPPPADAVTPKKNTPPKAPAPFRPKFEHSLRAAETLDHAETTLSTLPEAAGAISDDEPTGPKALPEAQIDDEIDGDVDDDVEELRDDATVKVANPLEPDPDDVRAAPKLPPEEDRTSLRSVVVEPVPPEAVGLRPDQVLPEDQTPTPTPADLEGITAPRVAAPAGSRRFLAAVVVIAVALAGAATGVVLFTGLLQTEQAPRAPRGDLSLIDDTARAQKVVPTPEPSSVVKTTEPQIEPPPPPPLPPPLPDAGALIAPEKLPPPVEPALEDLTEVRFASDPPAAEVYANQKLLCITPCASELPTGKHVKIRFQKRGLKARSLVINPGQDRVIDVTLHRSTRGATTTKTKTGQNPLQPWLD
jgi:serine/threonine protein kinase